MKPAPIKDLITFDDFEKLDIRVGTITSVAEVEKSKKLMKLTVDFGDHVRTILAGIKQERENPFEIEGKQALFVVNLPEQKMAGEVSQGMLFDIGYADKLTPCLAVPETAIQMAVGRVSLVQSRDSYGRKTGFLLWQNGGREVNEIKASCR